MSDNLFADLLESFKSGWDDAGKPENFSTQRVRSRPSFWNPFHTWRDEETRELFQLYEEVRTALEASPFTSSKLLEDTVTHIIVNACDAVKCSPPLELIVAMHNVVTELVSKEFFSFEIFDEQNWPKQLDVEEAMQLKKALECKRRFLSDADH